MCGCRNDGIAQKAIESFVNSVTINEHVAYGSPAERDDVSHMCEPIRLRSGPRLSAMPCDEGCRGQEVRRHP